MMLGDVLLVPKRDMLVRLDLRITFFDENREQFGLLVELFDGEASTESNLKGTCTTTFQPLIAKSMDYYYIGKETIVYAGTATFHGTIRLKAGKGLRLVYTTKEDEVTLVRPSELNTAFNNLSLQFLRYL